MIVLKKLVAFVLFFTLITLSGCVKGEPEMAKYSASFFAFDTLITLTGYAESQETFDATNALAETSFHRFHAIFDRFEPHEGVNGLWALNHAEGQAVPIEPELMDLLQITKARTLDIADGTNIYKGAVFDLWNTYRKAGEALPTMDELRVADSHGSIDGLILDAEKGLAQLADPGAMIDLGAVAKGYAVEQVARLLEGQMPSFLLNGGGNIRTGLAPADGRSAWSIGVTDPLSALAGESKTLFALKLANTSAVTSGGYQRYYTVDGQRYHHLIDPETLMPANYYEQLTIITQDSGLADFLSTAAFVIPYDASRALVEGLEGVDAIWVMADGSVEMTDGVKELLVS